MKQLTFRDELWFWNDEDEKLLHVNDWLDDVHLALKHVKNFGCAIQAGGAMGLWPVELAKSFAYVETFEPNKKNFQCLFENVKKHNPKSRGFGEIHCYNAGLGHKAGFCETKLHKSEQNNSGAYYTMPSDKGVPVIVIDNLPLSAPVGLIQLDVEGREYDVLKGAVDVIKKHWPVIMLEEKPLPQDSETGHVVGAAQKFLESLGYKIVEKAHRDIVMVKK